MQIIINTNHYKGAVMNPSRLQFLTRFIVFTVLALLPILASAAFKTVTVNKSGTGNGTVSGGGINCGTKCTTNLIGGSITLYASPDSYSTFIGWGSGCTSNPTPTTCKITVTTNVTIEAKFALKTPVTLTVSMGGVGHGKVTSSPAGVNCTSPCAYVFAKGKLVTLTATANPGSQFSGWSGDCNGLSCKLTMNGDKSVVANFEPKGLKTLTVIKNGTGTGVVTSDPAAINCGATCSAAFGEGTFVTLTATPSANSVFDSWSGSWGPTCGDSTTCLININATKSIYATFTNQTGATGKLNDTGIIYCATNTTNEDACPISAYPGQDADFGRDKTKNNDSNGHAGFSFTKLNTNGIALAIQNGIWSDTGTEVAGTKWSCVKDNVTGLIWQAQPNASELTWSAASVTYANSVNSANFCGNTTWRLPTVNELLNIATRDRATPTIDENYFPNTPFDWFWTSSLYAGNSTEAWDVNFYDATDGTSPKASKALVRLVSNGQ
jgi:hypothetical protein